MSSPTNGGPVAGDYRDLMHCGLTARHCAPAVLLLVSVRWQNVLERTRQRQSRRRYYNTRSTSGWKS